MFNQEKSDFTIFIWDVLSVQESIYYCRETFLKTLLILPNFRRKPEIAGDTYYDH